MCCAACTVLGGNTATGYTTGVNRSQRPRSNFVLPGPPNSLIRAWQEVFNVTLFQDLRGQNRANSKHNLSGLHLSTVLVFMFILMWV